MKYGNPLTQIASQAAIWSAFLAATSLLASGCGGKTSDGQGTLVHNTKVSHSDTISIAHQGPSFAATIEDIAFPDTGRFPKSDFSVAGVSLGMDSISVLRILGRPDTVSRESDFRDTSDTFTAFDYHGLVVFLGTSNSVGAFSILGHGPATARGVAVGDSISRLRMLYGIPTGDPTVFENGLSYYNGDNDLDAIQFEIKDSIVTEIYVGHIYD